MPASSRLRRRAALISGIRAREGLVPLAALDRAGVRAELIRAAERLVRAVRLRAHALRAYDEAGAHAATEAALDAAADIGVLDAALGAPVPRPAPANVGDHLPRALERCGRALLDALRARHRASEDDAEACDGDVRAAAADAAALLPD